MQNSNIRENLLIITKLLWLYSACSMIYGIIYQYIIIKREKYWKTAHSPEILNAFINIIHETNYFEWHKLFLYQILVNRNINYSHIVTAYNEMSMKDRITFWKYCTMKGLHPTFAKILSEHSPQ
jgi:hypothetical protein